MLAERGDLMVTGGQRGETEAEAIATRGIGLSCSVPVNWYFVVMGSDLGCLG